MHALIFGLQCAAYLERLDPSIYWMGMHHSRLVKRDDDGTAVPEIDPAGAAVRLGHSIAFFIGTAYGSTETAERLAATVRAMHHTIKGVRPDGARYDADDPEWLRWNYATVVWGLATAHELYHPQPLRGSQARPLLRRVRPGRPCAGRHRSARVQGETLECLGCYLPRLALTHGAAMATGPNLAMPQSAVDWAIRDTMPTWAAQLIGHRSPNLVERAARRALVWARDQRAVGHGRARYRSSSRPRPGWPVAPTCRTPCRPMCRQRSGPQPRAGRALSFASRRCHVTRSTRFLRCPGRV